MHKTMLIAMVCAAWCGLGLPVLATELREIEIVNQPYYLEVQLGFDQRPTYSESYRYDPDRYLLTINSCTLKIPPEKLKPLEAINHHLLTRISTYAGADNIAVGFYLNQYAEPLVRYDDTNYYLRFYTEQRNDHTVQLAAGLSLVEKLSTSRGENLHLYLVKVDPGAAATLFSAAADRYDGKTRRRAPSSFARREQAEVVVNGGFFGNAGEHLSTLIEDGAIRATGVYPSRPLIVITPAGQVVIGRFNVETALIANGQRIPVSARNYPYQTGMVMVYDNKYPIETLPQNGMYYYLLEDGQFRYYSASTSGLWLAPGVQLVASDIMPEVNPLRSIADGTAVTLETRITDANGQAVQAQSAIGGAPMLIEGGKINISVEQDQVKDDIAKSERSRTAVGLTSTGVLLLAVVKEQESNGYGGVTLTALSELMLKEGAVTAMNLDGGGSSAIVVAGKLLNLSESDERPVSNVLILKAAAGQSIVGDGGTAAAPGQPATLKYDAR